MFVFFRFFGFYWFDFLGIMLFANGTFIFDIIGSPVDFNVFVVKFIITAVAPDSTIAIKVAVSAAGAADILSFRDGIAKIKSIPVRKVIGGKPFSRIERSVYGIHPAGARCEIKLT